MVLVAFLLCFLGCCAARDILPPGPVDAIVGKNVTLGTLLDRPTYSFIIWNFSNGREQVNVATLGPAGIKVNEAYQGRVDVDRQNGSLRLSALTTADSGDFIVNILNAEGQTETGDIHLRVLEPVSSVAISSNLPEAVEHNSTVVLTCSAKGSFLKFSWLNKTTAITADGKRLVLKDSDTSSELTINGVLRTDLVGPIYCMAANKLETEKSAPFNLTVHYGPDDVTLLPADVPQFIRAGSDFNLTCATRSSPPATFTWYRNQTMMEFGRAVMPLEIVQKHPQWERMSAYTCRASNAKTQRQVASRAVSFAVMEPLSGVKVSGPSAVLMAGNGSANLSCRVTEGAVTSGTWQKDGKPLVAGGRVTLAADGSSVSIAPLQKEDNGEYECRLANAVSVQRASYKMVVNFGPEAVTVSGKNAVEVRDAVTLTCLAASIPAASFTWKFNGTLTNVKAAAYVIGEAMYKNTGAYMCQAHNAVTGKTATYTHNLSVKEEGTLDEGLSDGAIAGIVIGILAALGVAIAVIMYCRQKVPVESPY
ncbi:carcinoembryonic antigen-related cell adhesion molecule 6 [Dunckerocampus dactyliophorus]|uniref:carcinoembryonic antigen-related cell adhesion molecule 6 n=1 Tax=Dunckerocampus dactyliophorus TaxID=161453 RepID=UPI0024064892|nr:carcinoembryonic antigen-related cell adhesion molecule 6 [Dunckerocampus dactyliophorus]